MPQLVLKVDVDTYRGTRIGVPRLVELLRLSLIHICAEGDAQHRPDLDETTAAVSVRVLRGPDAGGTKTYSCLLYTSRCV